MAPVIGTAGWAIPAAERAAFAAEGTALQRYASVLGGVEVNSSFHRPHRRATWERWGGGVPDDFRFAVKMPKDISHVRRLVDADACVERFCAEVGGLGSRLALFLLQLPPSLAFDEAIVERFLSGVATLTDVPIVCEPRHPSWFEPGADALLSACRVARVAADPARVPAAARPGGWRGLTYWRLHGSPVMYRSPYGEARLRDYADAITANVHHDRQVWCMFDNTAASAALGDALLLSTMVGELAVISQVNAGSC